MADAGDRNWVLRVIQGDRPQRKQTPEPPKQAEADQESEDVEFPPDTEEEYAEHVNKIAAASTEIVEAPSPTVAPVETPVEPEASEVVPSAPVEETERPDPRAVRAAKRKARRRERTRKKREERLARFVRRLPPALELVAVSEEVNSKIRALKLSAAATGDSAVARKLAAEYRRANFRFMDLEAAMSGHPEAEAVAWTQGEPVEAWLQCPRADWLVWVCAKRSGWAYPGLWRASIECVDMAIGLVQFDVQPHEVVDACRSILSRLRWIERGYFRGEAVGADLYEVFRAGRKLLASVRRENQDLAAFLVSACLNLSRPSETKEHEPQLESVVNAALAIAHVLPQVSKKTEAERRADVVGKLEFLAPLVRKLVPVPVDPWPGRKWS